MFIIKPKYQYILLPLHYGIISLISIFNYFQLKKYKEIVKTILIFILTAVVFGLIIYEIILENLNFRVLGVNFSIIYVELTNIIVGYYFIKKQKKVLMHI